MPTDRPPGASCQSSPADGPAVRVVLVLFRALDYPAAHSMDAHWYSVDARGNVAVFDAGSSGPLPKKVRTHEWPELADLVRELGGRDLVGDVDEDDEDPDFSSDEAFKELAARGVFVFYCLSSGSAFIDTYVRRAKPRPPMHLDQLPPRLRKEFAQVPLPVPDFGSAREVQIVEHVPSEFYQDYGLGYYAPGQKEVRPIPGREDEYKRALPGFRKEYPKLRFADPDGRGTWKRAAKKGKKP